MKVGEKEGTEVTVKAVDCATLEVLQPDLKRRSGFVEREVLKEEGTIGSALPLRPDDLHSAPLGFYAERSRGLFQVLTAKEREPGGVSSWDSRARENSRLLDC